MRGNLAQGSPRLQAVTNVLTLADALSLSCSCAGQTGEICLNILKKEWSPAWSLQVRRWQRCISVGVVVVQL